MILQPKSIHIPHLSGVHATYYQPHPFDNTKPTLLLLHSFTRTSEQFRPQFEDPALAGQCNLIAIDVLDHGRTKHKANHWTYWDAAEVNIQVLDGLGIRGRVLVAGVEQGGWIATRMALLAPHRVAGIIPIATSVDSESQRTRTLGCWDAFKELTPRINALTSVEVTPEFKEGDYGCRPSTFVTGIVSMPGCLTCSVLCSGCMGQRMLVLV